ncbi:hypothetical protein ACERCG_06480 [Mannheimia sp. E30BD]|uniref:hypothetical protein n=1 Tax=Mannheimia sp. E30BD TaxID=3278708 RepID=UPI00359CF518
MLKNIVFTSLLLLPIYSYANEFTNFSEQGISLQIPTECRIRESDEVEDLRENAARLIGEPHTSTVLLSMKCGGSGLGANLRLSYEVEENHYPNFNSELESLSSQERRELEKEIAADLIRQSMLFSVSNVSVKILNREPKTGILIHYHRAGDWSVFIYNFPDESNQRKIILTLSHHIPEKEKFEPIFEKVINSLQF